MTSLATITLSASLAVATGYLAPPFTASFITVDKGPSGELLVEPVYSPKMVFQPENAVAQAIGKGELLKCTVDLESRRGEIDHQPAEYRRIVLNCDGARFSLTNVQFERNEP